MRSWFRSTPLLFLATGLMAFGTAACPSLELDVFSPSEPHDDHWHDDHPDEPPSPPDVGAPGFFMPLMPAPPSRAGPAAASVAVKTNARNTSLRLFVWMRRWVRTTTDPCRSTTESATRIRPS